jgi:hypothetical protein
MSLLKIFFVSIKSVILDIGAIFSYSGNACAGDHLTHGWGYGFMETTLFITEYGFRESGTDPRSIKGRPEAGDEPEALPSDREAHLVCVQCLHIITNSANRISVDGAHLHTFANPHGIVFEIGCYGAAPGCGTTGPPTDDFSWFKGYEWKIALCRRCLSHMGWQFISGHSLFYGLIMERLMELKIDESAS